MSDSQRYPLSDQYNANVLLVFKVFNSDNSYIFSCSLEMRKLLVEKPRLKIISFQTYQH